MGEEVPATSDALTPDPGELPAEDTRESFVRHTAVMSVGTALSRITGFLRLAAMAAAIGVTVTAIPDTYNVANTTPNIIYELALGGILSSVFVPVFVEWLERRGRDEAWEAADGVLTLTLVVLSVIAVIGAVFAPAIIRLYLSQSRNPEHEAQVALGAFFLRWFMPQIVFYGVGAVAIGLLNAHRRFAVPMFAPILNNVVVTVTFGVYAVLRAGQAADLGTITLPEKLVLSIGTTLGVVSMTVALWPSLHRLGYRWHPRLDWGHPAVRRLGKLALWVVVYVAANQAAYLVVIVLAGRFRGGYTAYTAAFILFQLPHAIFAVSVFTALLPGMSGRWAAGDVDGVRAYLSQGLRATAFVVIPATAGYLALALPIVRLLLEHGQTHETDAVLIAQTLRAFAVGLLFFSAFQLLSRAFYAMQDTRTPALVNVGAAALNIAVDLLYVLVFHLGVPGLALAHSTAYAFSTVVCLVLLRRRLRGLDGRRIWRSLAKIVPGAVLTAGAAWAAAEAAGNVVRGTTFAGQAVQVTAGVCAGLLVYVGVTLIFRMQEADYLKGALVRRFRR
ncbi:MAG: murein biosynthesis integral membrane protein MurJ [Actinobacteria bacterium]|nr:murein biosynthesis integral membrane protein MurJ [Actinomycetota bacterium]